MIDAIHRRKFTLNESKTINSNLNILGYIVGNINITPDLERMRALQDFPVPNNKNTLRRLLGMFAYYVEWINCFATKVQPLAEAKTFPLTGNALDAFVLLKSKLLENSLQSIDESLPFVVKCDASDLAISASLNKGGRPIFMSRT